MKYEDGTEVSTQQPPPHKRYLVMRDSLYYTATPCYGMHQPWWVVKTMELPPGDEAKPVPMVDTDRWWPI